MPKTKQVKGYCEYIFQAACLDFTSWWNSTDPDLGKKPVEIAAENPAIVIERAEKVVQFEQDRVT